MRVAMKASARFSTWWPGVPGTRPTQRTAGREVPVQRRPEGQHDRGDRCSSSTSWPIQASGPVMLIQPRRPRGRRIRGAATPRRTGTRTYGRRRRQVQVGADRWSVAARELEDGPERDEAGRSPSRRVPRVRLLPALHRRQIPVAVLERRAGLRKRTARTIGDPVAGLRRDRRRRVHGRPRPVDRERGVPVDPPVVPRGLDGHAVVGPRRLQRRVRRCSSAPAGSPTAPGAGASSCSAWLIFTARVAAVRHRALGVAADRRPGRPGDRCRPADAGLARPAAVRHPPAAGPRRWRCGAACPPSRSPPGPSLGSVLIDAGGWRWAFFVNLPVALVAGVAARRVVPESIVGGPVPDLVGVALLSAAVAALALAITQGGDWGWSSARVVGSFGRRGARPIASAGRPTTRRRPSTSTCSGPGPSCSPTPPRSSTRSASSGCCWPTSCS